MNKQLENWIRSSVQGVIHGKEACNLYVFSTAAKIELLARIWTKLTKQVKEDTTHERIYSIVLRDLVEKELTTFTIAISPEAQIRFYPAQEEILCNLNRDTRIWRWNSTRFVFPVRVVPTGAVPKGNHLPSRLTARANPYRHRKGIGKMKGTK